MTTARIYRIAIDTARHKQLYILFEEYHNNFQKLVKKPSGRYAARARKALINLKQAAHKRGIELLELYAPTMNEGKEPINESYKKQKEKQNESN
jgi:ABC-type uncharacterized transport system substrate-binding protein